MSRSEKDAKRAIVMGASYSLATSRFTSDVPTYSLEELGLSKSFKLSFPDGVTRYNPETPTVVPTDMFPIVVPGDKTETGEPVTLFVRLKRVMVQGMIYPKAEADAEVARREAAEAAKKAAKAARDRLRNSKPVGDVNASSKAPPAAKRVRWGWRGCACCGGPAPPHPLPPTPLQPRVEPPPRPRRTGPPPPSPLPSGRRWRQWVCASCPPAPRAGCPSCQAV